MADTSNSKQQQQQPRPTGIAAAALDGAKEGAKDDDRSVNPDEVTGSLARPAPGMTEQPKASPSSTNQYTGITGGKTEDPGDEESANPDAADETRER